MMIIVVRKIIEIKILRAIAAFIIIIILTIQVSITIIQIRITTTTTKINNPILSPPKR